MQEKKEKKQTGEVGGEFNQKDILFEWEAPARVVMRRGKEYFSTVAAILFLLTIVLFVAREFLLIGVIFAFAFFSYVLATVQPETIKNQLTKKGVRVANHFYRWEQLTDYWIEPKGDYLLIHINMPFRMPGRLLLLAQEEQKQQIMSILSEKIVYYEEPQQSLIDHAADWLARKIQPTPPKLVGK